MPTKEELEEIERLQKEIAKLKVSNAETSNALKEMAEGIQPTLSPQPTSSSQPTLSPQEEAKRARWSPEDRAEIERMERSQIESRRKAERAEETSKIVGKIIKPLLVFLLILVGGTMFGIVDIPWDLFWNIMKVLGFFTACLVVWAMFRDDG